MHGNGTTENSPNTDLFWALRGGGGGTYGVVTKFTYKLHPAPPSFVILICFMPMYIGTYNIWYDYLRALNNLVATPLSPEWGGYQLISSLPYPDLKNTTGSLTIVMNHAGEWGSPSFNAILPFTNKYPQSCHFRNVSTFLEYSNLEYSNTTDPLRYYTYLFNTLIQPTSFTPDYYDFILNQTVLKRFGCTGVMIGGNYFFLYFTTNYRNNPKHWDRHPCAKCRSRSDAAKCGV